MAHSLPYATLLAEEHNNVLTLTLNRPDVYNACNEQMALDLQAAFRYAAENDSVRCVVLTGAGKAFCSGQDLKEPLAGADGRIDFSATVRKRYNPTVLAMRSLPKPVIAGINGAAAGAGLSLALGCDVRIAAASARLVEGFTAIALIPDAGGTYFYTQLMGYAKAAEFVFLNEPLTAEAALQAGLVNRVVPDVEFVSTLNAIAETIARQPTKTLGLAKKLLQGALTSSLEDALEAEAEAQQIAGESEDFTLGVTAFLTKQQPVFRGK